MTLEKPWDILPTAMPRIEARMRAGHAEHGDTWRDGRYDALARLGCGGNTARLTLLDVVRKLDAYAETGELQQLEDAAVYLFLEYARRHLREEPK